MIVVTSCGAVKQAGPAPAARMYTGSYATMAMRWAESVACPLRIFVLSARYGLVGHDQVLYPYDTRLGDPDAVTAAQVRAQATTLGVASEPDVLLVAGRAYVALARQVWPHARTPFAVGRMGVQIGQMRAALGQVPTA